MILRLGRQELRREPAEDVVDDRLREADLRVARHSRRLESHVAELVDERLQRDAVLQRVRDRLRERVGEAGDRRSFLRHHEEDLAGLAVLEETDGDIALVSGDVELVGDRLALVRQPAADRRARHRRDIRSAEASRSIRASRAVGGRLLVLRRVERLRALAAVAVDRNRFRSELPRLDVGLHDLVDARVLRHVDGLADRARDERLRRAHHLDVAHVLDRPPSLRRLERAVEHGEVRFLQAGRPFDRLVLVDVVDDGVDLRLAVPELPERHRHGLVDDLHQPAADQLLVLDQRDVGLDARRIAVHHEPDRTGRREHGRLRVPESELLADLDGVVPRGLRRLIQIGRDVARVDVAQRVAVLPHDAEERVAVLLVPGERTAVVASDPRRLRVGFAGHQRRQRRRHVAAGVAVVRQAARHQQRAEVRVAEAERTIRVRVLLDRRRRVARVVDDDFLRGDQRPDRRLVRHDVELAVFLHERHQVDRREVAR